MAAWLTGLQFDINVERLGLKPPRFDGRALLNNDYYRSFDQYLNDSFSLRDPLVFGKRWLDYHLFNMTDTAAVHVGKQGWLYERETIDDFQKKACDNRSQIESLTLALHAVDHLLSTSGRRFIFTVAPNKSTIYPEYLGFIPTDGSCGHSHYDLLLEAFERHPLNHFVRLEERLRHSKNGGRWLYNPTGSHWNASGAAIAAEAIGEQIDQKVSPNWSPNSYQKNSNDPFDLARQMLGLSTPVKDNAAIHMTSAAPPDRLEAVVYGDGYLVNLIPYLSKMMDRIEVVETDVIPPRRHAETLLAADMMLLETAESLLGTIRLNVDKIYTTLLADNLLSSSYPIDLQAIVPEGNIALKKRAAGLEIKSVGDSSRFTILAIPGSDDQTFRLLKLAVDSSHSDTITLKFETDPPVITHKALRAGFTKLYLPLPFQKTLPLSIKPGRKPGVLMLRSAEILTFAEEPKTIEPRQLKRIYTKWLSDRKIASAEQHSETLATTAHPARKLSELKANSRNTDETSQPDAPVSALKAAFDEVFANQEIRIKKGISTTTVPKSVPITPESNIEKSKNAVDEKKPLEKDALETTMATTSATGLQRTIQSSKDDTADKNDQTQISSVAAAPMPALPAITLSDFADGCIFQRRENSADIVISGTYRGPLQAIEARVVKSDTQEQIVPWTVIDPSPENGIFVGQMDKVPQGGWYNLQIRSQNHHSIMAKGKHRWGVGMLIGCLGQSNMNEWFHTGKDLKAHSLLRKFNDQGWSRLGTTGNAAIAFGNQVIDRLGIPVGLLDFAVNGSGLRKEADYGTGYWADTTPTSIYNRFLSGVSAVGGALEFVIWVQGEADAARGTVTHKEYVDTLTHFIEDQVRSDISNGSDREHLPFLVVMMIKRPGGKDHTHQAIRDAQKQVVDQVTDCYLAATTLDLKNHGRQHLKPKAYISMGNRVAQTVLYIVGQEHYHRGPQFVNAKQVEDRMVEIIIRHNGGDDFIPVSGISGWEIIANGKQIPIQEVYRHDAHTIRIVTEQPLIEHTSVRYLHGAMPDVSHPVIDNSSLALPLEEFQSEIN